MDNPLNATVTVSAIREWLSDFKEAFVDFDMSLVKHKIINDQTLLSLGNIASMVNDPTIILTCVPLFPEKTEEFRHAWVRALLPSINRVDIDIVQDPIIHLCLRALSDWSCGDQTVKLQELKLLIDTNTGKSIESIKTVMERKDRSIGEGLCYYDLKAEVQSAQQSINQAFNITYLHLAVKGVMDLIFWQDNGETTIVEILDVIIGVLQTIYDSKDIKTVMMSELISDITAVFPIVYRPVDAIAS